MEGVVLMTVLGKHTIADARDLATSVEFRIKAIHRLMATKPGNVPLSLIKRLNVVVARWRAVSDDVVNRLTLLSLSAPLVAASIQPAEPEYQRLESARVTQVNGDNIAAMTTEMERAVGAPIDERDKPTGLFESDPDFAALRKLDSTIKSGEKLAKDVKDKGEEAATSKTGIIIIGGLLAVGAVVVAVEVAPLYVAAKSARR
jgi:hypothetical protein